MIEDPVAAFEALATMVFNPVDTGYYLGKMVVDSLVRDVIHGDAESRAHWFVYASSTVLGPKAVKQVGKQVDSKAKAVAQKAEQQLDDLLPYHPKHQVALVGPVPYHVLNGGFFVDRLIMMVERLPGSLGGVNAGGRKVGKGNRNSERVNEVNLKNIDGFINGNKKFDEVIGDYAKVYKEKVDLNKPWSWDDTIPGGDSLSSAQKRQIKEIAIEKGHIPEIKVTKKDGLRYGFADFARAGFAEEIVQLPRELWRLSDKEQFKWLDEQIGGTRKGMTWHHTEIPGKMELVPFGIHNITPHNGGRTKGMWADAPRY